MLGGCFHDGGMYYIDFIQNGIPDRRGFAPILIGAGIQPQQITHRGSAQLPVKGGAFFSYALQFGNFHFEQGRHSRASFWPVFTVF